MEYKINEYHIHEPGRHVDRNGNPRQEDCILPSRDITDGQYPLFVVCDGMGGSHAGDLASSTVCKALQRSILRGQDTLPPSFGREHLARAVSDAYDALDIAGAGCPVNTGTTLAMLLLTQTGAVMTHIGNSRVYHIRPGRDTGTTEILYSTTDHTVTNYLLKTGKITPEQAAVSDKRNTLTRLMQPNMQRRCHADVHLTTDIRPGDYFLLCSDGMLENIDDQELRTIFSNEGGGAASKRDYLLKATSDNSDNHSALIVHILQVTASATEITREKAYDKKDMSKTMEPANKPYKKKSKPAQSGGAFSLIKKGVASIVALLCVIMLIYYLFVRQNENLQQAGTAVDAPTAQHGGTRNDEPQETYGYEITAQDIINEAQEIAPEIDETAEQIAPDSIPQTEEPPVANVTEDTETGDNPDIDADSPEIIE